MRKFKLISEEQSNLKSIFLIAVTILILFSVYSYYQIQNLIESSKLVNHTNEVKLSLKKVSKLVLVAETNQKSYLLVGNEFCLDKRNRAVKDIYREIHSMNDLIKDNPYQVSNFNKLQKAIAEKIVSMDVVLKSFKRNKTNLTKNVADGIVKTANIELILNSMENDESKLLASRTEQFMRLSFFTPLFAVLLFLTALFVVLISYRRMEKSIRQLKAMKSKLESEKNFTQTILDSSTDNIMVLDKELRYVLVNPKARKVLETITSDYIGKKVVEVLPNSQSINDMEKALRGETVHYSDYFSAPTGLNFEVIFTPLIENNQVNGVIIFSRDITNTLKTKKILEKQFSELEERNDFVEKLLDSSTDLIIVIDHNQKVISLNKAAETYLAESAQKEKVLNKLLDDQVKDIEIVFKEGNTIKKEQIQLLDDDHYYQVSYIPLNANKVVSNVMILCHDITENVKKQYDLENTNKELESFTYVPSHDLQEPLRKIRIFSGLLVAQESDKLSEAGKNSLNKINDAAERMQTLIEDLLAYSRTANEPRTFELANIDFLISELRETLSETIKEKNGLIVAENLGEAKIIPFQFRQLMYNLLTNALKFSKPGVPPKIAIIVQVKKGTALNNRYLAPQTEYFHIQVSDNGIGFSNEYSEKIFNVFQRLHTKDEVKGTGIGLSIVKKIVENHGGLITASGEVGSGARFDVYIPQ